VRAGDTEVIPRHDEGCATPGPDLLEERKEPLWAVVAHTRLLGFRMAQVEMAGRPMPYQIRRATNGAISNACRCLVGRDNEHGGAELVSKTSRTYKTQTGNVWSRQIAQPVQIRIGSRCRYRHVNQAEW
jgi:hypothetical protein